MDDATPKPSPAAALRVLASGSSGNCSVLLIKACGQRRIYLIDAGLSPRRTRKYLQHTGLSFDMLDGILLTHLDHDHWQNRWVGALPRGAVVRLSSRHAAAARRQSALPDCAEAFDGAFDLYPGIRVEPIMGSHDDLGVASFR